MDTASFSPCIEPSQLSARIGRADAPLLLDVRRTPVFEASDWLIAGARHCPPEEVAALATREPPRPVIVYCAYGHGVSQGAAAALLAAGWDARWLAGGIEGGEPGVDDARDLERWRASAPLRIRKRPEFGVAGGRPSRWITRARPKIDRIACPWLIRRFIDPRAEFFYVPDRKCSPKRSGSAPSPSTSKAHRSATVGALQLRCAAAIVRAALARPRRLAGIVRGADTSRLDIAPQAAGLLALSLGLSRLHADDDHAMLAAALPMYDALFEWCRAGQGETHSWRVHQPAPAA